MLKGDGESSMHADLTFIFGTLRFLRTHTHIRPLIWRASWSSPWYGDGWRRQARIDECFFNTADWTEHRCPPLKFAATKSTCCWCSALRTPSSRFFATPAFFGICVVDVYRNHGKTGLAIFAVSSRTKHKRWRLVVPILTVLLSQHVAVHL